MEQPPPPPPHGTNPGGGKPGGRTGGLPDGRYDIFVVPPHSSGSGFLYLPSLQTQRNSFLAGCFCTAASFFVYTTAVPVVKEWLITTVNGGGAGVFMLICFVAVGAWAFGKTQSEWSHNDSDSGFRAGRGPGGQSGPPPSGYANTGHTSGHTAGPPPPPPNHESSAPPPNPGTSAPPPHSSWQRPPPQANTKANTTNQKSSWDKAREETRKREEERKRAEELKKRKEELDKERQKQREKDALERLERERREKREKEDKANMAAQLEKEKEKLRQAAELARAKAEAEAAARERTEGPSTPRRPPMPSAATEREDDAYSFRPYDRPRRAHKANSAASMYSESTYAPSVNTARTTPPPTARGPYSTTDPDKIIIKGVFSFNNAFTRTPISQLVSNQGQVSDGLILRITTEGLFIDDDVRGVPQREWDVKAWTMKSAEVWCPYYSPGKQSQGKSKFTLGRGGDSSPSETDAFIPELLSHCLNECRVSRTRGSFFTTRSTSQNDTDIVEPQSCEIGGMHILRASIRDLDGRKFVFILSQSEGWKVAVGLQRLRRGKQVQAFGVAGLPQNEAKAILHNLGFG
ncbi:hypothetical protein B0A52_06197 [Exophiala mesophila]|uniref:Uncharacterized protein n=1 Tax=Exophiala mesophila TaxID=212818 RepID=A0A438N2S0_EXOME|nr:hypothetical protein B0A52_06197 [Exophiala mesophila]